VMFRFVSAYNTWYLDDVKVTGGSAGAPSYVAGYSNRTVAGTSQSVTGLTSGATYYFRARAVSGGGTSSNSPTASVTTTVSSVSPSFGANPGPVSTTSGVAVAFTVSASGTPTPTLALLNTTASSGYSFTPATGQLSYTPPQADGGTTRIFRITASNSAGVATQMVSVLVTAGTAPSFTGGAGPYSTTTGVAVAFTVSASGTPAAVLALQSTTASNGTYSFTPGTGQLSYTPPASDIGTRTFTITASNIAGVVTQTSSVIVSDLPAIAPQFGANPGPVGATTGVAVAFTVATTNGKPTPTLALQSTTASSGYSFTPATGQLNYTPPEADAGTKYFTFTASNSAGVASQTVSAVVTAGIPGAPASIWASATNSTGFTAAWSSVPNATGYRLDVGTNNTFTGGGGAGGQSVLASNEATMAAITNNGWSGYALGGTSYVQMTNTGAVITSAVFSTVGFTNLTVDFRARTFGGTTKSNIAVSISADNGTNWTTMGVVYPTSSTMAALPTLTNTANLGNSQTRIRWQATDASGGIGVGVTNLVVKGWSGGSSSPAYVPGYSNLTVAGTSQSVTGLAASATYYFRARAVNGSGTSSNSSVANVTTTSNAPAGTPPVMNIVTSQAALTGRDVARTVTAAQTDGDPILSYACTSVVNVATWDFDTGTGYFLFVPTAGQIGANVFSFTASDKDGTSSPVAMTVTVSAASAPTMNAISNQIAAVGAMFEYTATATEPDGDAVAFACTSAVDEATWAVDTNGYFLFEPTAAQLGTNFFVFRASDRDGTSAPVSMSVKVYSAAATNDFTRWVEDEGGNPASSNFIEAADYDFDGMTTWEEYLADTDPALSNSVLKLSGNYFIAAQVSNTTGQIRFSFPASARRYYQLEYCTDLTNRIIGTTNLGWGVPGMVVTSAAPATWYGVIRVMLNPP
jgi:large repetitive protein